MLSKRNETILWLAVLLLAAAFRLAPIAASLPYIDYVDEGYALHETIHLLNQRTFDTNWYVYPSLPAYLTATALVAWNPIYRRVHGHSFRRDLPREEEAQTASGYNYDLIAPPELVVAGRSVAAGLSIATVVLAAAIAARIRGRGAGLIAMLITAVCPALVLRGSNVIVDTFATFFALLAIFFCERIRPNESRNAVNAAAASVAAGLAFACKYNAGAVFAAILWVVFTMPAARKIRVRLTLIAFGGLFLGIALGAPATILNWQTVIHDVAITTATYRALSSSPGYFGQAISAFELGWPLVLAGAAGLLLMLRRRSNRNGAISWLAFAVLLLAALVTRPFQPFRNLLPLVPLLCVAAAIAFFDLIDWALARKPRWLLCTAAIGLFGACTISLAVSSFNPVRQRMVHRDSRVEAIDWLQQHTNNEQTVVGLRELAILPAEWKRVPAKVTIVSFFDEPSLLERDRFDYVVTGEFDLRYATDPARASALLTLWKKRTAPLGVAAEFGTGPAFVVPYLWRTNDERIIVLQPKTAKSD